MKKLIAIFVVLLFAAPVIAADWSFYGSERIATWYVDRTSGKGQINGQNDDAATQWYFQGNSRLGAKVKADKVTGQVELALGSGGSAAGNGDDTNVTTRRAYGVWNINDTFSLKVGKDYSPVTDFISNQWFAADNDLLGEGNFYGRRPAGLTLNVGALELAFLTPSYGGDVYTTQTGIVTNTGTAVGGDPDSYIPRFETAYQLKLGPGYIRPFGGVQYYTVNTTGLPGAVTKDQDVLSWMVGVSTNWNIGAFSIGGQLSYGANEGQVNSWSTGSNPRVASSAILQGQHINDSFTTQALLVAGLKFTDTLRFEVGAGYRMDDPQVSGAHEDEVWVVYGQAMITMAPGVYFCPEVGYYDYMDGLNGDSQGYSWYAGAKWQIDF